MNDILKKAAVGGLAFGGLEYLRYRMNGGKPLLERIREIRMKLMTIRDRIDGKKPITIEADDYKIV